VPHLGQIELQKLRPATIDAWHATLPEKGGKDGAPLSARTVGHAHRVLHVAIKKAVKAEVLARNVVAVFAPPKVEDEEVKILDEAAVPEVLTKLANHVLAPIADLGLATGCRRGELLALAWDCVDLNTAVVKIERSLEETRDGLRFKPPKTKAGRRALSLPQSTVAVLREHRRKQLEQRLANGLGRPAADALVFCQPDGRRSCRAG
jgi:integrase